MPGNCEKISENVAATLVQANIASKNDIADFVKKTDWDDKLKNLNEKVNQKNNKKTCTCGK